MSHYGEKEFKYLKVLFMSEGKIKWETDRRIGAVMQVLHQTLVVKKELSLKLSIYQSFQSSTMVTSFG